MSEDQPAPHAHKKSRKMRVSTILLILLCLIASGASVFFFTKYRQASSTGEAAKQQLLNTLGKTIELPSETPAIVTVTDKDKLTNKALAARLENNDELLIFGAAKRLIVYRPSIKKVIDMLTFQSNTEVPATNQK